jgi:hypothetical protein
VPLLGPQNAEKPKESKIAAAPVKPPVMASDAPAPSSDNPVDNVVKDTPPAPPEQPNQVAGVQDQVTQMQEKMQEMMKTNGGNMPMPDLSSIMGGMGGGNPLVQGLMMLTQTLFMNPAYQRAINRTKFAETGDAYGDNHHSGGNVS